MHPPVPFVTSGLFVVLTSGALERMSQFGEMVFFVPGWLYMLVLTYSTLKCKCAFAIHVLGLLLQ